MFVNGSINCALKCFIIMRGLSLIKGYVIVFAIGVLFVCQNIYRKL